MTHSACVRAITPRSLEDPFFGILTTHLLPCASHSLSIKLCFACFPPTALGSFPFRLVKYSYEWGRDLQASGSQHNQLPPSSCKSRELTPRSKERSQGQGKHLVPSVHCFWAAQCRTVPQPLRSPCGFPQHDRNCHTSLKVSPFSGHLRNWNLKGFLTSRPRPFLSSMTEISLRVFRQNFKKIKKRK